MGGTVPGAVFGLRLALRDGPESRTSRQGHTLHLLAVLAVPAGLRIVGRQEGGGRGHDPRDAGLVRTEPPARGREAGGDLAARHGAHLGPTRRLHLPDRHDAGPTVLPATGPGLVRLPHARPRSLPVWEQRSSGRRGDGGSGPKRRDGGLGGPEGASQVVRQTFFLRPL